MMVEKKYSVFIPEPFPESSLSVLDERFDVRQGRSGPSYSEDELVSLLAGVDAIVINSRDFITERVMQNAPWLRVIAKAGSKPSSNVDLAAAQRRDIRVTWTPGANATSVAEMAIAMMLTLVKRLPEVAALLHAGGWRDYGMLGNELSGKTLGLIGVGAIGSEVARLFQAFGGIVVGYDPYIEENGALAPGVRFVGFRELLAESDIVSLHCEMNARTARMINAEALAAMKPGALLVNTARGGLIDEKAVLDALNTGRLRAAALDVFEQEPPSKDHVLIAHPNVFATPHISAFTHEASARETRWALEDVALLLQGREPIHFFRASNTA